MKSNRIVLFFILHIMLMVYSTSGIFSKMASGEPFLSFKFCLFYGILLFLLALYAVGWQQMIKRMPLTTAYANKAVTVVWGLVWGLVFFDETLTPGKMLGALMVVGGIVLFALSDGENAAPEGLKDTEQAGKLHDSGESADGRL